MNFVSKGGAVLALATLIGLGGCVETGGSSAVTPIVGKRLVSESGDIFLFDANGSVSGRFRGAAIAGTYISGSSEICSTYTAPEQLAGQEFCSTPAITGDRIVFNRRDGSQSQPYRIEG